jgi:hypothetical protein
MGKSATCMLLVLLLAHNSTAAAPKKGGGGEGGFESTCSELIRDALAQIFTPGIHAACEHRGYYYVGGIFNTAGNLNENVQNFARYHITNHTW